MELSPDSVSSDDPLDLWHKLMEEAAQPPAAQQLAAPPVEPEPLLQPAAAAAAELPNFPIMSAQADLKPGPWGNLAAVPDTITELWYDPIRTVLAPYREQRGRQLLPFLLTSQCSGLTTERMGYEVAGLDHKFVWTADPKPEAYFFGEENQLDRGHHFTDIRKMTTDKACLCMKHVAMCKVPTADDIGRRPNDLTAGVSCRGFSTTNFDRLVKGAMAHPESDLFEHWISQLVADEPDTGCLENVFGMVIKAKADTVAPLTFVLDAIAVRAPMYDVIVLFLDSIVHMVLSRKRLFVHVMHERCGGAKAHARQVHMLKAGIRRIPNESLGFHRIPKCS